ncbi:PIG-L family deacetylase [Dactylosporangium sp. NPDC000244]|uniref:PIG-L deacetylase family protein n=1 Tax=Dactylosporangium sp. NPDC000244 TaxID=3154365 RepID=UPI003330CB5F
MPSRRTLLAAAAALAGTTMSGCDDNGGTITASARKAPSTPPGRPWILVVPHPDDETLGSGVLMAQHVAAGRDVHILLLTRGMGSNARAQINGTQHSKWWGVAHNPVAEGYAPLTPEAFGAARFAELTAAVGCLGGATVHEAGLTDAGVTVAQAKAAISKLVTEVGRDAGVYAPSWVADDNPDHRAAGQALRELAAEEPRVYGDVRWYVLPPYWTDDRLKQVSWAWVEPTNTDISNRARNACRAYGAWQPPHSYAIGYHSVDYMFAKVDGGPKSMVHT